MNVGLVTLHEAQFGAIWCRSFIKLAAKNNIQISYPVVSDISSKESWISAWDELIKLLEVADALIIPGTFYMLGSEHVDILHRRINEGTRVLFQINPDHLQQEEQFLRTYGMSGSHIRIRNPETSTDNN